MKERYQKIRTFWIEKLGGKCAKCDSTEDLEFDHINPKEKLYEIAKIMCHAAEKVAAEMTKCQLLCKKHHSVKSSVDNGVEHGGGVSGKRNCKCDLCRAKKAEYMREYKRNKRL